jgi:hypothetical protein
MLRFLQLVYTVRVLTAIFFLMIARTFKIICVACAPRELKKDFLENV